MHFHVFPFLQARHIWRSKSYLKTLALALLLNLKFTVGCSKHQSKIRVMECNPSTAFSGKKINFGHRKKVSWAFNLEEVKYFSADFEFQQFQEPEGKIATTDSMQTKLKKKPHALRNKRFASLSDIGDGDFIQWVRDKGDQVVGKISGQCSVVIFKDLTVSVEN